MVVLQFALGDDPTNPHLPQNHQEQSVVYTGTHDNDTTRGWWESPDRRAARVVGARPRPTRRGRSSEAAWASRAALAVAPLQDVLSLGTEARMNLPGTEEGNWQWRFARRRPDRRARRRAARADGAKRTACAVMPGEGVEPPRPEGQPVLSRPRLTNSATPAGSG